MQSLSFLGTGGSVISRERMCSGILFQEKLIDVGYGVLTNLVRSRANLDRIDEVYVSHVHSDHVGDFTGLVWAMAMEERTKPLKVVSSASSARVLREILRLQATPKPWVKFDIEFVRPERVGVKSMRTKHKPENLAYRFETGDGDFVYVGDTTRYDKVAEFAHGVHLMIHEATFLNGQESVARVTNHSTARDAGTIAKKADVGTLVLTHISPNNASEEDRYAAEAREIFDGEVVVARDNMSLPV